MSERRVILKKEGKEIFFHVDGDSMKYYDLECLVFYHPEMVQYVKKYRINLERRMLQAKEMVEQEEI